MNWTQADLDQLKAAIAGGVLSVTYSGPPSRSVTFQSLAEMRALAASMAASIKAASGGSSTRYALTRKGFGP